ncbi:MAG TPA: hypothetical protein DD400_01090 [Rhodospirillaceae bacterium]|nr:hypothetical protein [Rhodospirillaceae bacterium]
MASTSHGSAEFSEHEGFSFNAVSCGKNIVFGRSRYGARLFHAFPTKKHFLSVAPTRSGKGACLIIPNLLFYIGSTIVIDPKGENAFITAERRRALGQKTHILDPWGETNRRYGAQCGVVEDVATFNPLSILDPDSKHFSEDIVYISDALIINQGKDPHWDNSARELVAGLIAYAVIKQKSLASLSYVRTLLTGPREQLAAIATESQKWGYDNVACRKLGRFTDAKNKEISSIISTALTQLAFLDSKTLSDNLEESSFSFEELVDGTATIYLVLPVDKLQTFGRWLRIMISIGIRTVARNTKKLPAPVLFVLDEFGTIGKLSAVSQAVGLMAGLQMCIWVFVQDFIQLKRDYPDEWETFIANSECVSAFNIMDQFTAEHISRMLGSRTVERISQATEEEREGGFLRRANPDYMKMTDQEFSRALLHPDEIRRLRADLGLIIPNADPATFTKIYYFDHAYLFQLCRPDPYFTDPNLLIIAETNADREQLSDIYKEEKAILQKNWQTLPENLQELCEKIEKGIEEKIDNQDLGQLISDLKTARERQISQEKWEATQEKIKDGAEKARVLAVKSINGTLKAAQKFKESETFGKFTGKMKGFFKPKD